VAYCQQLTGVPFICCPCEGYRNFILSLC